MPDDECPKCFMIRGLGCACTESGGTPAAVKTPPTIVISASGLAHWPDCWHLSDSDLDGPDWGRIPDATSVQWTTLSAANPLTPTVGNLALAATKRCLTCER